MNEVSRDEFEELTARVVALESLAERTWSIIGHLDTSLREIGTRLDRMDDRFDSIDRQITEVNARIELVDVRTAGTDRAVRALLRHFDLDDDQ